MVQVRPGMRVDAWIRTLKEQLNEAGVLMGDACAVVAPRVNKRCYLGSVRIRCPE